MKLIYELIITTMETLGLVCMALGLGVLASWWAGAAGFLIVAGGALLAAAGLSARQQRQKEVDAAAAKTPAVPPAPPVTRSRNDVVDAEANGSDPSWLARVRKVLPS